MWSQVEIDTDGTYLAYFPFVAMSLAPQVPPYHNKLCVDHHWHKKHQHLACVLIVVYRLEDTCAC